MLFDADPKLIRTLMKKKRLTARDVIVKKVEDERNPLVYVAAKTEKGLIFVKEIMCNIPRVEIDEPENPEGEDLDEGEEEEDEEEEEEDEEEEDAEELWPSFEEEDLE